VFGDLVLCTFSARRLTFDEIVRAVELSSIHGADIAFIRVLPKKPGNDIYSVSENVLPILPE
jgi:hypothetical protein